MPKSIKILSSFIIFAWSVFLIVGLAEFMVKPFYYAFFLTVTNILYIISGIGLRRMKRWSVYLFIIPLIFLYGYALIATPDIKQSAPRLLMSLTIPMIYCLVVFPHWNKFE